MAIALNPTSEINQKSNMKVLQYVQLGQWLGADVEFHVDQTLGTRGINTPAGLHVQSGIAGTINFGAYT